MTGRVVPRKSRQKPSLNKSQLVILVVFSALTALSLGLGNLPASALPVFYVKLALRGGLFLTAATLTRT